MLGTVWKIPALCAGIINILKFFSLWITLSYEKKEKNKGIFLAWGVCVEIVGNREPLHFFVFFFLM